MIVVIDNYDSFTYNLVQYLKIIGSEVFVFRNDAVSLSELEEMAPAGFVISPGPGRPEAAGISMPLIDRFSGKISDSGRLPRSSGNRCGHGGQGCFRQTPDARQDLICDRRRANDLQGHQIPFLCDAIPFPGRGEGNLAGLPESHCRGGRRRNHGHPAFDGCNRGDPVPPGVDHDAGGETIVAELRQSNMMGSRS